MRSLGTQAWRAYRASIKQPSGDYEQVWVSFTNADIDFYRGPNVNDQYQRHYWTGASVQPQVVDGTDLYDEGGDLTATTNYLWGIPRPSGVGFNCTPPSYTVNDPTETRSYVYTFVNQWGEESAPSDPTDPETGNSSSGSVWTLTGIDDSYGVSGSWVPLTHVRIYRTITGTTGSADFRFVAEVPIGSLTGPSNDTYSDTIPSTRVTLNEELSTTYYEPAPGVFAGEDSLEGIVALPNGVFAGWIDSDVYFSEPYQPHTWPRRYTKSVGERVIGLGVYHSGVVVATDANPRVISGAHPDNMTMIALDQAEPCKSRRSIVSSTDGVYYVSQNGVVLATEYGAQIISKPLISRKEWQTRYQPENMQAAVNGQGYIAVYTQSDGTIIGTEVGNGAMVDIGNISYVRTIQTDTRDGEVFVIRNGGLYQWNVAEAKPLPYRWESKTFETPFPLNFAAFKIKWEINEELKTGIDAVDTGPYNEAVWDYTVNEPNAATDGIHTWNQFAFNNSMLNNTGTTTTPPVPRGRKVYAADMAVDEFYPDVVKMPMGGSDIIGARKISLDDGVRVTILARVKNDTEWTIVYQRIIKDENQHHIKSTFKADLWRFRLESSNNIYSFVIGEKGTELAEV